MFECSQKSDFLGSQIVSERIEVDSDSVVASVKSPSLSLWQMTPRHNSHIGTAIGYFSFPPLLFFLALSIAVIYNQSVGHGIRVAAPSRAQRAGELVL